MINWFAVAWVVWAVALFVSFGAIELLALKAGDLPGRPRTLTANVRWLVTGAAWWHALARLGLAGLLAWLQVHFGLVSA